MEHGTALIIWIRVRNAPMTLSEISQIAGGLSLLVATATFLVVQIGRSQRARQEQLQKWQKVVVFRLIAGGESDFNRLRLSYLASVLQFEQRLPRSDLQDATLQLLLMQLLADKLVMLTDSNEYVARRALARQVEEETTKQMAMAQIGSNG
jgi:hypothetical protein